MVPGLRGGVALRRVRRPQGGDVLMGSLAGDDWPEISAQIVAYYRDVLVTRERYVLVQLDALHRQFPAEVDCDR